MAVSRHNLKRRAAFFKALGHPTRLLMVEKLVAGECCVCELAKLAGADVSTVSRHLSVLKHAGVVEDDKRGLQVFYSLKLNNATRLLACVETALRHSAARE